MYQGSTLYIRRVCAHCAQASRLVTFGWSQGLSVDGALVLMFRDAHVLTKGLEEFRVRVKHSPRFTSGNLMR